jgi:hypothetical protein
MRKRVREKLADGAALLNGFEEVHIAEDRSISRWKISKLELSLRSLLEVN